MGRRCSGNPGQASGQRLRGSFQGIDEWHRRYDSTDGVDRHVADIEGGAGSVEGSKGEANRPGKFTSDAAGIIAIESDGQAGDGGAHGSVSNISRQPGAKADGVSEVGIDEERQIGSNVRRAKRNQALDRRLVAGGEMAGGQAQGRMSDHGDWHPWTQCRQAIHHAPDQGGVARPVGQIIVRQLADIPVGNGSHAIEWIG